VALLNERVVRRIQAGQFVEAIKDGRCPISLGSLAGTSRSTFAAMESVLSGKPVEIPSDASV